MMSNDLVPSQGGYAGSGDPGGGGGIGFGRDRASEIRSIMKTDRARYFRDHLDQELAEIEAGKSLADDPDEGAGIAVMPLAPHRSRAMLEQTAEGRELVAAWQTGGFERSLESAQRGAMNVLRGIGDGRHQRAFMARFDRDLTERVRYHIYDDLTNGSPLYYPPAKPEDLKIFGSCTVGADLLKEWGSTSADKVGKVWARVARFRRALGDEGDFEEFRTWYDNLNPTAVKAIVRYLAQ